MLDKIDSFLLDYPAYGGEPLHIIISTALDKGYFKTPEEIIERLYKLVEKGYYTISSYKYGPKEGWITISKLTKKELLDYIKENRSTNFEEFPSDEYYFQTTDEAYKLVDQDTLEY